MTLCPLINETLNRYAHVHGCPMEVAFLAEGEVLTRPARCTNLPPRFTAVYKEKGNSTVRLVQPNSDEGTIMMFLLYLEQLCRAPGWLSSIPELLLTC